MSFRETFRLAFIGAYQRYAEIADCGYMPMDECASVALYSYDHAAQPTWPALRASLVEPFTVTSDPDAPLTHEGAVIMRCSRIAFALAHEIPSLIRDDELTLVRAAADNLGVTAPQLTPPITVSFPAASDGDIAMVETVFVSPSPPRPRHRRSHIRAVTHVPVRAIAPEKTSVAYRLRGHDGEWIDILNHEGDLYRPVLCPGTWSPISADRFATAMSNGESWRDSPTSTVIRDCWGDHTGPSPWIDDYASGEPPANRKEAALRDERETEIRQRCEGLALINGRIWKRTPPLGVRLIFERNSLGSPGFFFPLVERRPFVTWQAGTLHGAVDQSPFALCRSLQEVMDLRTESPRQLFPIALEPLLRTVVARTNKTSEEEPMATLGDGSPLPVPSLAELVSLADAIEDGLIYLCDRSLDGCSDLKTRGTAASEAFRHACTVRNVDALVEAAQGMYRWADEVGLRLARNDRADEDRRRFFALCGRAETSETALAITALVALADETFCLAHVAALDVTRPIDHEDIAAAFSR